MSVLCSPGDISSVRFLRNWALASVPLLLSLGNNARGQGCTWTLGKDLEVLYCAGAFRLTGMAGRSMMLGMPSSAHRTSLTAQPSAFSLTTAPKSCSPSASPQRLGLTPQEAPTAHPWYHVYGTTVRMWSQDDTHLHSTCSFMCLTQRASHYSNSRNF